jgi:hypothetical protein
MSKHRRKTGPGFWIWTFIVGIHSTDKGKRRIAAAIKEKDRYIAEREVIIDGLQDENRFLREKLAEVTTRAEKAELKADALQQMESRPAKVDNEKPVAMGNKANGRSTIPVSLSTNRSIA